LMVDCILVDGVCGSRALGFSVTHRNPFSENGSFPF